MKNLILSMLIFLSGVSNLNCQSSKNVILITLDGFRWQEMFGGAVDSMMNNDELTRNKDVIGKFSGSSRKLAREKLMPWFWNTLVKKGQLHGNRWEGSKVNCTNRFWFSYPGYNEILTGYSDPEINSNAKKNNTNTTILEWMNNKEGFKNKVAAFCSWDVFPYIINEERSGVYVNSGFDVATGDSLSQKEIFLNELQPEIPSHWASVRMDAFTHHYAVEYMKKKHPRLVYISYGETDDFAHDGRYDHYLNSAHQTDQWISQIWDFVQSDDQYKDKTTLIITTDHGRGHSPMTEWKSHGTIYQGSNQIWIAAIGPDIPALGEVMKEEQLYQNQVAKSVAKILGFEYLGNRYKAGDHVSDLFIK